MCLLLVGGVIASDSLRDAYYICTLNDCTLTQPSRNTLTSQVPTQVLSNFYASFLVDDDGYFLGAEVEEIQSYLTFDEVLHLISVAGYAVHNDKIIDKHKPRVSGGCKYNKKWLCQFKDVN